MIWNSTNLMEAVDPKIIAEALSEFRDRIDRIDGQILELLNSRAQLALEIGRQKKVADLPVYAPEREKAVLERLVAGNQGPLPAAAVESVFRAIIQQVRMLEDANH